MKKIFLYKYYILLIIISISIFNLWYNPNSILSFGDWYHIPNIAAQQLYLAWGTWISWDGTGNSNIQLYVNFFQFIRSGLVNLGLDSGLSSKLIIFIPISILLFISPYILIQYLFKNPLISFVSAVFYGTTTYGIINQPLIQFIYAIAPLMIYLYYKFLDTPNLKNSLILSLLFFIGISYEIRIMYIVLLVLLIITIFNIKNITYIHIKFMLFILVISIILNLYWFLPTLFITNEIKQVTERGLFGGFLFDLHHSMTLSLWNWTGKEQDMYFNKQPIIWYFWFYPFFFIIGSIIIKNKQRNLLIFSVLLIIGILLSKQSSAPFPNIYEWLYYNFPTFNLFREASKFYILLSIGYLGIIGYYLNGFLNSKSIYVNKYLFNISIFIIIGISCFNAYPIFSHSIGGLFSKQMIPSDYEKIDLFFKNEKTSFRILWVPQYSRWGYYNILHPKLSFNNIFNVKGGNDKTPLEIEINKILNNQNDITSNRVFNNYNIKYIIIPSDNEMFHTEQERNNYIRSFNKVYGLEQINIGLDNIIIFKNKYYTSHISGFSKEYFLLKWSFLNPSKYNISLTSINNNFKLSFLESFHKEWKLYLKPNQNASWCNPLETYNNDGKNITECEHKQNFFEGEELSYLYKKPLFENTHHLVYDYANGWTISKDEIIQYVNENYSKELQKEGYPKQIANRKLDYKYYTLNPDGSIDVELTLYFKPQSYFYLGLIISGTTFVLLIGYLGFDVVRNRRRKEEENQTV